MGQHKKWAAFAAAAWLTAGGLRAADAPAAAATPEAAPAAASIEAAGDDAFKFFLQEAEVVTASRRAQKKSDSPVAIDVITREDIEKSGAMELWDLLRFRVGLDVNNGSSIEGQPAQVNVRGIPNEFSQSLQVLIDGRSVVSALNSGVFWRNLPVALEDIERIEIVRGPNSALFGANAGQGVINIITRKTGTGGGASLRTGELRYSRAHASGDFANERMGLRVSMTEARRDSFPIANGDTPANGDQRSKDRKLNLRANVGLWEGGTLELFGGVSDQAFSVPAALGINEGTHLGHFGMLQVHQNLGEDSADLMLANRHERNTFGPADAIEDVQDLDAVYRLNLLDGSSVSTFGGSLRHALVTSPFYFNYNLGSQGAYRESNYRRAYLHESYHVTEWLTLALAGSYESSDIGGDWPAYQGAVILKPFEGHSLRLSGSKSPTLPSMSNKFMHVFINSGAPIVNFPTSIVLPGFFVDGTDVQPAQVASYEATWSSALLDRQVLAELTAYQMEIAGLPQIIIGSAPRAMPTGGNSGAPFFMPFIDSGVQAYHLNSMNFVMRGVETALTYKPVNGTSVQLNHTYEDVYSANSDTAYDNVTPWNKVNLLVQSELPYGFNAATQLGWVGKHRVFQGSRASGAWIEDAGKLDLRLGYKPHKDLEFYAVAANLADERRVEAVDSMAQPQMYWGGVNVAFGGK